ncbi:hypothetical protein [Streptomyces sp. LaPpAH-108]|nr:hypothetical protein [Streptomyces sp. LaPpAH-108]
MTAYYDDQRTAAMRCGCWPMHDVLPVDDTVHRELSEWLALVPGLP